VPGIEIGLSPLAADGTADGALIDQSGLTGEVCVAGAHVKDRYDRLWATERLSSRNPGWHRTGDVGHLDNEGRLWIEGRLVHVITTADGPVTPVGIEQRVESLAEVALAAVVGVGPAGTQQVVVVIETGSDGLADPELTTAVRAAAGRSIAAVLTIRHLPVDIRHASKIDRTRVAGWADRLLAGERGRL
jgi:acyl-coenzyme A synthetase/AMP-(fatty) acid ligase